MSGDRLAQIEARELDGNRDGEGWIPLSRDERDALIAIAKAARHVDKLASNAHEAMWEMDFDTTAAGTTERDEWKRLREQASNEIWKLHDLVRPALARLDSGAAE